MGLELERRFSSVTQLGLTLCQASLSITNSQSSLKLTSIESVMPSSHLILCRLLLLLPSIPPSIRVFSNESVLWIGWPILSIGISASTSVLPVNTQDFPYRFSKFVSQNLRDPRLLNFLQFSVDQILMMTLLLIGSLNLSELETHTYWIFFSSQWKGNGDFCLCF